jgi:hypothetical protein
LEDVRAPLVAHPEPAKAEQPSERALCHPAVATEPLARVDATLCDARGDASDVQGTAEARGIVGFVGVQLGRASARSPWLSPWSDDGWNRIDKRDELGGVVRVGGREPHSQRDAAAVNDEVVLGATLAAVDRVSSRLLAPLLARTLRLSTLARHQSIAAASPNQLWTVSCNRCHTPAFCQSRNRRQQVVLLPHPSALGTSRQGHPVLRTKTMPPRAARSETRGRPLLGLGGSLGSRGSMASQRSSETRDVVSMVRHHATSARFCDTV